MIEWNAKDWMDKFPFLKIENEISLHFDFPRVYRKDFYQLCKKIKPYYKEEDPFILMQLSENKLFVFHKKGLIEYTQEKQELEKIVQKFNEEINKKCFICGKKCEDYDCRRSHKLLYNMCPKCEEKIFD